MVSGESHYFLGRRMRLRVIHDSGSARVAVQAELIEIHVRPELRMPNVRKYFTGGIAAKLNN